MQRLIKQLTEAAGGYVAGNLNRTLENVFKAFFEEVRDVVNAQLKKSAMLSQGDVKLVAYMEPSGFDWPVLVVKRDGEIAYDLEMTLDTGDEQGEFVVNAWEDVMQKDTKVLKLNLNQMAVDTAASFLINFVRKDVATQMSKK
jgi:hypothetical protein